MLTTVRGLPVLTWAAFARPGEPGAGQLGAGELGAGELGSAEFGQAEACVSTRAGGVSTGRFASLNLGLHVGDEQAAVLENRRRLAVAVGATLDDLVFCEQTHQPSVAVVTAADRGRGARSRADALPATDALVTTTAGLWLVVMVADCVPLVLLDPVAGVLGVVHAGWAGTVRGVTPAAVAAMARLGALPARIVAGIGPSIRPDQFQIGDDVAALARAAFGERAGQVVRPDPAGGAGRWLFDLWRANALQLELAGVPAEQIELAGAGTGPGTAFFSHRFEAPTGRFAAIARLRPG